MWRRAIMLAGIMLTGLVVALFSAVVGRVIYLVSTEGSAGLPGGLTVSRTVPGAVVEAAPGASTPRLTEVWVRALVSERMLCHQAIIASGQWVRYMVDSAIYQPEQQVWRVQARMLPSPPPAPMVPPPPPGQWEMPRPAPPQGSWIVDDRTGKALPEDGLEASLKFYCTR